MPIIYKDVETVKTGTPRDTPDTPDAYDCSKTVVVQRSKKRCKLDHSTNNKLYDVEHGAVIIICVIIDIEYPRGGLIRLETFDQVLVDVRAGMN